MASLLNMSSSSLLKKGLPYDARIEYLESSGTQYINTGISSTLETKLEVKCSFTSISYGRYGCVRLILGNDTLRYYFGVANSKWIAGVNSFSYDHNIGDADYLDHVFVLDSVGFYIDGVKKVDSGTDAINVDIALCDVFGSTVSVLARSRLYYAKIWHDNVLVFDAIPVRIGQVGCMYDKVSGQIFGNEGTGAFILGPDKQ